MLEKYPLVLKAFITDRLSGRIAPTLEKITSGRGGRREGAGRPRSPMASVTVRLPKDVAEWLKAHPDHIETVRNLMV